MPNSSLVSKLVKSDRRKQWTELKSKHKAALAAKKVDFGAKFGAALDKYQLQLKATDKLLAAETLNQAAVDKILVFARPLSNVADHYLMLVKGLGDPAEKELAAFLKGVVADCNGWEQVSNIFEQSDVPAVTAAQLAAVKGLYGPLDRLSGQLENLGKSFSMAQAELKSGRNKGVRPAANNVKMSSADWAALKNLAPDQWARMYGAKMDAAIASAARLAPTIAPAQRDVQQLLNVVARFERKSDYAAFKERARTVAAASVAAFHQEAHGFTLVQSDPEILSRLGLKGLGGIQNTRASSAVAHGREYADALFQGIHRLP